MTLDEEMTKTKAVDLEKLCNFIVHNFFLFEIIYQGKLWLNFLKFEIQILQMTSDGEMTKLKL
jgi:hypothetical protein